VVVIAITLAVFAATLAAVSLRLRATLRTQIAGRDAHLLNNLATHLPFRTGNTTDSAEALRMEGVGPDEQGVLDPDLGIALDAADSEVEALLQSERLGETTQRLKGLLADGVLAVRLFDAEGRYLLPVGAGSADTRLRPDQMEALRGFEPVTVYRPAVSVQEVYGPVATSAVPSFTMPLLEVWVPLRSVDGTKLVGINQVLLEGSSIAAEFRSLDRSLLLQGSAVFLAGGLVIGLALTWAFGQLERANRLLAERTASLVRANTDLARSARAAAVGAVSAHLLHGLKNPVAGLQHYLSSLGQAAGDEDEALRAEAASTTRRMQSMIQEIARVLREENGIAGYEVTLDELREMVSGKAAVVARSRGVRLDFTCVADGRLSNHQANLVMLILENLVANAIQATPSGKTVAVTVSRQHDRVDFEVRDEGPGVPSEIKPRLFAPVRSTKPDGLGMGLAISKQLADHLGADLDLCSSGPDGSAFRLALPLSSAGSPASSLAQQANSPSP